MLLQCKFIENALLNPVFLTQVGYRVKGNVVVIKGLCEIIVHVP